MSIALSIGNNLTTGGVFTANAVNNTSVTNVTDFASVPGGGVLKLLSTQTASDSTSVSFTSGLDSTYDSYVFKFINIHPRAASDYLTFQVDTGTNTNYNQTMTSTTFYAYHLEDGTASALQYVTGTDQAQGTDFQKFHSGSLANDADTNLCGTLQFYNPSSTTYVKHFQSRVNATFGGPFSVDNYVAGYINTTTAITRIQFKMINGNFDGIIKMYGVV